MWTKIATFVLAIAMRSSLGAQPVLYSPYFHELSHPTFQVAGKAGEFYWVEKEITPSGNHPSILPAQAFDVYNNRMSLVQRIADPLPKGTIREYLIAGNQHFDKLILLHSGNSTQLLLQRRSADGTAQIPDRLLDSLPITENGKSFILLRSPSGNCLRLIAFESTSSGRTHLYSILFDQDWHELYSGSLDDPNITQPCIQDDFVSFPVENFDNLPVKLADNGDWLMTTPSRRSNGFLFFHFCDDGQYSTREIKLSPNFNMEDVALTVDDRNAGASVGILSTFQRSTLKQLQVTHYSIKEGRFDFDSSYLFNTLPAGDLQNRTLVRESLIGLSDGGYLFCKEYGRENFTPDDIDADRAQAGRFLGENINDRPAPRFTKETFAHTAGLQSMLTSYDRGDLAMFYFPTSPSDSTWSGIIHSPQTTEMNWPSLSYLVMPQLGKLLFVYNSHSGFSDLANTVVVDRQGNPTDGDLVFWKFNRSLNFQHAHQLSVNEVAVPYLDRPGFAVIRL